MARPLTILSQRVRRIVGETEYAHRRLFEIRTGLPVTGVRRVLDRALIAELEAHWRV